ncbi:MAG: 3-dehydroquinate synthase [Pedosphaera sp.]|nr:3-dehydroquinate synthase [Pedosphaera sp.]
MSLPKTKKLSLTEALQSARETRALEIGIDILGKVPEVFKKQFPDATAVIVADSMTFAVAAKKVVELFDRAGIKMIQPFIFTDPGVYAEHSYVVELENSLKLHQAIPVAVGSGAINDLTKLAAHRVGRPYMVVGTAASMDGYTAFGASITFEGSKQTFNCPAPVTVVADLAILRKAPAEMTASGYADLLAKVTAGADWILADALGVEPIEPQAWNIVQGGLRESLNNPTAVAKGDAAALAGLTEGLMLGGFAMQWAKSSRPASGAEHQFSHLWDMQHHTHNGQAPSHGFKVGIATLAVTALYEHLLEQPLEKLNVSACCAKWPSQGEIDAQVKELFIADNFTAKAIEETQAKYISRTDLEIQLNHLQKIWPELKTNLRNQLIPFDELKRMLSEAGAPVDPGQIGISRQRLRNSCRQAYHIRRRFTVLDLMVRTGLLEAGLDSIFGAEGRWSLPASVNEPQAVA